MQVLSQLSYNPTIGPLIGAGIGRHAGRVLPGCSTGEFHASDRRLAPSRLAADRQAARTAPASTRSPTSISADFPWLESSQSQTKVLGGLAGWYAITEAAGAPAWTIGQMAAWHGSVAAFGVVGSGLIGWRLVFLLDR
jgi:hypothetical protein